MLYSKHGKFPTIQLINSAHIAPESSIHLHFQHPNHHIQVTMNFGTQAVKHCNYYTHGCYVLWKTQDYIIMFSDKLCFNLTVKGLLHVVTILRTCVCKGKSGSNRHCQINKATFEAYTRPLHSVLRAPITVSHRTLNALRSVKCIIPKMNI